MRATSLSLMSWEVRRASGRFRPENKSSRLPCLSMRSTWGFPFASFSGARSTDVRAFAMQIESNDLRCDTVVLAGLKYIGNCGRLRSCIAGRTPVLVLRAINRRGPCTGVLLTVVMHPCLASQPHARACVGNRDPENERARHNRSCGRVHAIGHGHNF